jgi:tRNA A-37 threonylcarbamoyl transferase component Bud32
MASSLPAAYQQTVQMASPATPSPKSPAAPLPAMMLVEGSGPQLSGETECLLQERLRLAALLMAFGFLTIFVKSLLTLGEFDTTLEWLLFSAHTTVMVVTGLIGLRLHQQCPLLRQHLRGIEAIVFGGPAVFTLLMQYVLLSESAALGYLVPVLPPWMFLIFVYALFIPNTWRRAAVVIGLFAVAPVLLIVYLQFSSEAFSWVVSDKIHFRRVFFETTVFMFVTSVAGVLGVATIGRLRTEAFEARQIGQYRLKHRLGSGGMGEVYLAEHVLLKRPCAIKIIRPEKAGDPQALARFEREVRETARLTHWNTVEIYDYGRTEDGTFYYVMEYLPGMNLEQLVAMNGPLPPERVIYLMTQVCDGLHEAHEHGLVHRDIKPANIFAARRGGIYDVAKLLDFGLVKSSDPAPSAQVTQEGMVAGSPLYMSPEQAVGEDPDVRSDIYSLGLVMYYLLTGRAPFDDAKPMRILLAHVQERPLEPSRVNPLVPADLEAVVMRCLEKSADRRFPDAPSLQRALEACAASGGWNRELAAAWWHDYGCPHKKQLDAQVLEGAAA